jgi:hypothetical protein
MTIRDYKKMLYDLLNEFEGFDDDEPVEEFEEADGGIIYIIGKEAIESYGDTLN